MDKSKIKVGFVSLGCAKNQVNTERMMYLVKEAGYTVVGEDIEADVMVVNTCGFIESAKRESIETILDLAWLKEHRDLRAIIAAGCLSERYREQILDEMPEVDAVLGTGSYEEIVDAIGRVTEGERFKAFSDKNICEMGGERLLSGTPFSAYLKIGEGCNNRCTYCAIPMIRGSYRSRPMDEIVKEAVWLEEQGVKEINLIAQDTSIYGVDLYGHYCLDELIRRITEQTKSVYLRVLYCYPDKITDALLEEFARNGRLIKYIDLPIQHISDRVLKRMNRHGDAALIRDTVKRIREKVPGVTLRTTAIVGFPCETEEDFEELCAFIKEAKFDRFGAFAYSREEDTPAYDLDGQIDEQTKQTRLDTVMAIQADISAEKNAEKVGRTVKVLVEGWDEVAEAYYGRSGADAPDVDGKVFICAKKNTLRRGTVIPVRITESMDYDLIGEPGEGQ